MTQLDRYVGEAIVYDSVGIEDMSATRVQTKKMNKPGFGAVGREDAGTSIVHHTLPIPGEESKSQYSPIYPATFKELVVLATVTIVPVCPSSLEAGNIEGMKIKQGR